MPQMSPMSWVLIYVMLLMTLLILFSGMPKSAAKKGVKTVMATKENKMKW